MAMRCRSDGSIMSSGPDAMPESSARGFAAVAGRFRVAIFVALALVLTAWHVTAVLALGTARIDGRTHFLINDDEMITMRYGRNLASGAGLVYNSGERVEGFTSPLMALVMSGLHLLTVPPPVLPVFVQLMNLALSLAILFMLFGFFGGDDRSRLAGMIAGLFYVILPSHSYHAHAGFEVYMTAALLVWGIRRIERMTVPAALLVGLLPLTHATAGAPWAVLVFAILVLGRGRPARALVVAGAAALPVVAWEVFRLAYYGAAFPNSFYLKAGAGTLAGGLEYLGGWLTSVSAIGILGLFALVRWPDRKTVVLGACVVVQIVAAVSLGGDIFPQFRFLFPTSVLLCALAGWSVATLAGEWKGLPRPWRRLAVGLFVCAAAAPLQPIPEIARGVAISRHLKEWNVQHVAIGLALRDNTPPGSTVALFGLGYAGYYCGRPVIDMLGKVDARIARVVPNRTRVIGHSKSDFDYVFSRAPDFVECGVDPAHLVKTVDLEIQRTGPWGYNAEMSLHPEFRRLYAPNPARDAEGRFLLFYARSAEDVRTPWTAPEGVVRRLR